MRLVLVMVCMFAYASACFAKPIEIYVAGQRYDSIDSYRTSKAMALKSTLLPPKDQKQVQEEAQKLGFKVDPSKVRTIVIKPSRISPQTRKKLNAIRSDGHVDKAISNFKQNWTNPHPEKVDAVDLENRIKQAVGEHKEPVLLISDPKKVRIMTFSAKSNPQSSSHESDVSI